MLKSNISYWKEKSGRSNKWIAKQLGVSEETVSRWINDKGMPSVVKLFNLAVLLECKVDDLYKQK